MKLSVQVIVHPDDDTDDVPTVREVFTLDRDDLSADTLGLRLAEAKDLLVAVQDTLVEQQVQAAVAAQAACPACGKPRRHKDTRTIVVRSLFGVLRLPSPRWWHCDCRDHRDPHLRAAGRAAARAHHPGAGLPAGPLRRAGLLRPHRRPARRAAAAGPDAAPHRGTPPDPGRGPAAGGRTRRRAAQLHRHLPTRPRGTAPPGPAAGRRPGRRLRALQPAALPHRRLVRGDRRQGRPDRGHAQLFRVRADLRHQTETAAVRSAESPGDAGQPAGHLPHRRRRGHPRPALLPQPPSRAPARLVPPHHAHHRHGQHGQVPATPATGPGVPHADRSISPRRSATSCSG